MHPTYARALQSFADNGLRYVCECEDEGCNSIPEGFSTLAEAIKRAAELDQLELDEYDNKFCASHRVFELFRDADGDIYATFEKLNQ